MMLTKEECEKALEHFEKCYWNQDCSYGAMSRVRKDLDILNKLIHEHFSNPPLKFDELNKGYPIYDNDEIVCGWKFIYMIDKEYKQLLLIDEEGNVNWVNYEENRFYRKEVQE